MNAQGPCLEITEGGETRREPLQSGVTRLGGVGADVVLAAAASGGGELLVFGEPLRITWTGEGAGPTLGGEALRDATLAPGEEVRWGEARIVLHDPTRARLEEIPLPAGDSSGAAAGGGATERDRQGWRRVRAGLVIESGLADREVLRRWRERCVAKQFDADACAEELLAARQGPAAGEEAEQRLLERSGTLLRDFLMAATQKGLSGSARRVRHAARSGTAFFVAQLVAVLVYTVLVLAALLLLRIRGIGVDEWLDRILSLG